MSSDGFLRSGRIIADLAVDGKTPNDNEALTISVIIGRRWWMFSFKNHVGMGSRLHDLLGDPLMIFSISSSVVGSKQTIGVDENGPDSKKGSELGQVSPRLL